MNISYFSPISLIIKKWCKILENNELMDVFFIELEELLKEFEESLENIKKKPEEPSNIKILARIYHTLKGNSGYLGLENLYEYTRSIELFLKKLISFKDLGEKYEDTMKMMVDSSNLLKTFFNQKKNGEFSDIDDSYLKNINEMISNLGF